VNTLTLAQVRCLNDAVLQLYDGVARGDFESAVLAALQRLMPAASFMVGVLNRRTQQMTGRVTPHMEDIEAVTKSFNRLRHQHPCLGRRSPEAQSISQHLPRREWHRRDLYAELFRPYEVEDDLALEVEMGNRVSLMLGTTRSGRNYTPEDRILMTLLGPHLCAAWQQSQAALRLPLPAGREPNPGDQTVEVNLHGRVVACGATADALLRAYFEKDAAGFALPAEVRGWFCTQRTASVRRPLHRHGANGRLTIHYVKDPIHSRHFLLLDEQPRTTGNADANRLENLGLSGREQEVLYWVAQGKTNATVARILGISPGTVKRHLENIYSQLGVENRHAATLRALQSLEENRRRPGAKD
jgi:DNA-binding CsgD family transcriptional regulator